MTALQFGNPQMVVPWIATDAGVPPVLIAMIVPVVQVGLVVGPLFLGPDLLRLPRGKWPLALSLVALAGVIAAIAAVGAWLPAVVLGTAILPIAFGLGLAQGIYGIVHQDIITKVLERGRRAPLLVLRPTVAGVLSMLGAAAIYYLAPAGSKQTGLLLWVAVVLWLLAGAAGVPIAEAPSPPQPRVGFRAICRRGWQILETQSWFQDFMVGRGLLMSVELAIPFYTIYVASQHAASAQNLTLFVFTTSLGLLLSGPVWGRLIDRHSHIAMAAGAGMVMVVGIATLAVDVAAGATVPLFHAVLFALLTLGRQGVVQARSFFLSTQASPADRPICISLGDGLMSAVGMGVAFVLGWAAQLTSIFNPLLCLIALNLTAVVFTLRVLREGPRPTATTEQHTAA